MIKSRYGLNIQFHIIVVVFFCEVQWNQIINPYGVDETDAWYWADLSRYALLMKLTKDYIESLGHSVVSIAGFNEPDAYYAPAPCRVRIIFFLACINSSYFDASMLYCAANTLNPDITEEINISKLPKRTYILKLINSAELVVKKVIID